MSLVRVPFEVKKKYYYIPIPRARFIVLFIAENTSRDYWTHEEFVTLFWDRLANRDWNCKNVMSNIIFRRFGCLKD